MSYYPIICLIDSTNSNGTFIAKNWSKQKTMNFIIGLLAIILSFTIFNGFCFNKSNEDSNELSHVKKVKGFKESLKAEVIDFEEID